MCVFIYALILYYLSWVLVKNIKIKVIKYNCIVLFLKWEKCMDFPKDVRELSLSSITKIYIYKQYTVSRELSRDRQNSTPHWSI